MSHHIQHTPYEPYDKLESFVILLESNIEENKQLILEEDSLILQSIIKNLNHIFEDGFIPNNDGIAMIHSNYNQAIDYYKVYYENLKLTTMEYIKNLTYKNQIKEDEKPYKWILLEIINKMLLNTFNTICEDSIIMQYYHQHAIIKKSQQNVKDLISRIQAVNFVVKSDLAEQFLDLQIRQEENQLGNLFDDIPDELKKVENEFENHDHHHENDKKNEDLVMIGSSGGGTKSINCPRNQPLFSFSDMLHLNDKNPGMEIIQSDKPPTFNFRNRVNTPSTIEISNSLIKKYRSKKSHSDLVHTFITRNTLKTGDFYAKNIPKIKRHRLNKSVEQIRVDLQRFKNLIRTSLQSPQSTFSHLNDKDERKSYDIQQNKSPIELPKAPDCPDDFNYFLKEIHKVKSFKQLPKIIKAPPAPYEKSLLSRESLDSKNQDQTLDLDSPTFEQPYLKSLNSKIFGSWNDENIKKQQIIEILSPCKNNKLKNSEVLYQEHIKPEQSIFDYRPKPEQQVLLQDQNYKCMSCRCNLNVFLKFFKVNYCHYTGYWYCNKCMADNYALIPWYVLDKWDFNKYPISRQAKGELEFLYSKNIISIDIYSDIIKKHKELYKTLVLKRQVHLMFDMICEISLFKNLIEKNGNLLIKSNLFSLKDLHDIYTGVLQKHLKNWYNIIYRHITQTCLICKSKGKICGICNKTKYKIYPFDMKNTAFCQNCKGFYHSQCLNMHGCYNCYYQSKNNII